MLAAGETGTDRFGHSSVQLKKKIKVYRTFQTN